MKKPGPNAPQKLKDKYERGLAATRRWFKSDVGKAKGRERQQKWRDAHPGAAIAASRKRDYGVSAHDFQLMLDLQGSRCAICRCTMAEAEEMYSQSFGVDHDHETGKNRGLLCPCCNSGIGMLKDSPELLRAAADYLERAK